MSAFQQNQQAQFSAAAAEYDRYAHTQRAVANQLFEGLAHEGEMQRILDIGCGTGSLTRHLAIAWPDAEVEGIDHAPGMIEAAQRLNGNASRPRFILADAKTFSAEQPYDLLASSSTLHWVQPLDSTLRHLTSLLAPNGAFAFAIMLEKTLWELHALRAEIAPDNTPAERMPTHIEVLHAIANAGLLTLANEVQEFSIHAESAAKLLQELRALGVTGGPLSRGARSLTRGEMQQLIERYDTRYRDEKGVRATYHVGYYWGRRRA